MPKILPTDVNVDHSHDGFKVVDRYPNLKLYNDQWDLSSIILIHKLYSGNRITYDKMGRIVDKQKITKWGPFQFQCQACNLTRQTYEHIIKHQEGCKKLI